MSNFCDQKQTSFKDLAKKNGQENTEAAGCGCKKDVEYEPLTKMWFKEWAGVIALVVSLVMIIARNN